MLTQTLFAALILVIGSGNAAPPQNAATGAHRPGPLDLTDALIGTNDLLRRHPELRAQGWQRLAPGMFYKFRSDGVDAQVSYLDMDATTLPTVRRNLAALTRRADVLGRPATPAEREQLRVYRMHADALREGLADVRANLRQFGGLEAYQRRLIEDSGIPTAGLTLQEAKAALYEFQESYAGETLE